jgi:hypothetical protein
MTHIIPSDSIFVHSAVFCFDPDSAVHPKRFTIMHTLHPRKSLRDRSQELLSRWNRNWNQYRICPMNCWTLALAFNRMTVRISIVLSSGQKNCWFNAY